MPFTSDVGNEISPALSASGKLAFIARGDDGRAHVFVKETATTGARQVTRGNATDHAPTWSPAEDRLAFVRVDDSGCRIVIAPADGHGAERTVGPCASRDEFQMSWSPDGRSLAITAGDLRLSSPSHIELLTITTGERRALTSPFAGIVGDYTPAFSPDGRSLAFVRVLNGSATSLCVAEVDRPGNVTQLTDFDSDVLGADWDRSGRYVIFSSDRAGAISLWRIDARATTLREPELIAGGGNKLKHPSVARRTGAVAYEDWQYEINLRELATDGSDEDADGTAISATADRWNFHPQISPDGTSIAFQSTRSGAYELWISNRDGSGARQLTASSEYKSMPRWSPDSRQLVFAGRNAAGKRALSVVDVRTGAIRELETGAPTDFIAPSWSADGTFIYVGGMQPNVRGAASTDVPRPTPHLWQVNSQTGARGTEWPGRAAALPSLDGRWLFTATLYEPGLQRIAHHGNERVELPHPVTADQWPNWGVYDGGTFHVSDSDSGEAQLFFMQTGDRQPTPKVRLPGMAWPGVAVSRDGSRVIYAHADRRSSNIGGVMLQ